MFRQLFALLALSIGIYIGGRWLPGVFGLGILLWYLYFTGRLVRDTLVILFDFQAAPRVMLLGMFGSLLTLSFIGGAVIFFVTFSWFVATVAFFVNGLLWLVVHAWFVTTEIQFNSYQIISDEARSALAAPLQGFSALGTIVYLLLLGYGGWLLYWSRTGHGILTPWQTIAPSYIYVFALATFILGLLIFSRLSRRVLLFLLVIHSFLLHSYLPLTHELLYGADQWRHMANEERILDGSPWRDVATVSQPSITLSAPTFSLNTFSRLSYGNFWMIIAILQRLSGFGLVWLNAWFGPVVWSIVFPLFLFEFAEAFKWPERHRFIFVWLGFLPFAWQALGSMTLPVAWGFLGWLLSAVLILKRLNHSRPGQAAVLFGYGTLSFFGYILFLILFALWWAVAELVTFWTRHRERLSAAIILIIAAVAGFGVSVVEIGTRYSYIQQPVGWLKQLKQLIGNFTGWYLATGPRPHLILTGNVIFNQVPSYAFVSTFLTEWRGWLVGFMVIFWLAFFVGIIAIGRRGQIAERAWGLWAGGVVGSYIVSRYFLGGENILTRRLDVVVALVLLFFVLKGVGMVGMRGRPILRLAGILFVTVAIAASYSLGPTAEAVSTDAYRAMAYVWSQEQTSAHYCVLADTYPLLALEALSHQEIVGGGFPINSTFGQPERTELYQNFMSGSSTASIAQAFRLTQTHACVVVAPIEGLPPLKSLGSPVSIHQVDSFSILWYTR